MRQDKRASMKWTGQAAALALLIACALGAEADDRSEYNRRAADRDLRLFHSLDLNADGAVTLREARGDINFLPRFDDMEVDMDGIVTLAEVQRYIERHYGIHPQAAARPKQG